jgi:beta-hydroxylase
MVGSMTYVYKYRGLARYDGVGEYLRRGWPVFTPLNCLLYIFSQSRARPPIMNLKEFSELDEIKKNWQVIQKEAINLRNNKYFESTNKPGSAAYYDIGFQSFFKYGWSKFYLTWYGYTHKSAKELCPETVKILEKIPSVNGAMFSYLPAGSQLSRHLDPSACSLRYHLGLATPNSDGCFINIDNVFYSWCDGEALLFDETLIHYAKNNTDQGRLILMCDIDRPMNFLGNFINFLYKGLARLTVVPNLEGDKRGFANILFSGLSLSPIINKSKDLKVTNKPLYLLLKYTVNITLILIFVNITLILIFLALLAGASELIAKLIQWALEILNNSKETLINPRRS